MNYKLSVTRIILLLVLFLIGCHKSVKRENQNNPSEIAVAQHAANEKYTIDTKESVVIWKGANLAGTNSHTGYVYFSKGTFLVENGLLTGGTAEVDMNTLEDENHSRDDGLIKHLKNQDFFDAGKFPNATIVFTRVAPAGNGNIKITANLTIKGITHPVTFDAKTALKDGRLNLNGFLFIDRTQWDIRYKSGKFYEMLADETISDNIEFTFKILGRK